MHAEIIAIVTVGAALAYVALGARRSVREAARQHHIKALSAGEILGQENTTVSTWLAWSSKHKWVSRANARDDWIARASDDQIVSNVTACKLALTTRALDYLTANDGADFLRAARALSLHFPPMQRVADVSERIEETGGPYHALPICRPRRHCRQSHTRRPLSRRRLRSCRLGLPPGLPP